MILFVITGDQGTGKTLLGNRIIDEAQVYDASQFPLPPIPYTRKRKGRFLLDLIASAGESMAYCSQEEMSKSQRCSLLREAKKAGVSVMFIKCESFENNHNKKGK